MVPPRRRIEAAVRWILAEELPEEIAVGVLGNLHHHGVQQAELFFQFLLGIGRPCEGVPNADLDDAPFHGLLEDAGDRGGGDAQHPADLGLGHPGVVVELRGFYSSASEYMGILRLKYIPEINFS